MSSSAASSTSWSKPDQSGLVSSGLVPSTPDQNSGSRTLSTLSGAIGSLNRAAIVAFRGIDEAPATGVVVTTAGGVVSGANDVVKKNDVLNMTFPAMSSRLLTIRLKDRPAARGAVGASVQVPVLVVVVLVLVVVAVHDPDYCPPGAAAGGAHVRPPSPM